MSTDMADERDFQPLLPAGDVLRQPAGVRQPWHLAFEPPPQADDEFPNHG